MPIVGLFLTDRYTHYYYHTWGLYVEGTWHFLLLHNNLYFVFVLCPPPPPLLYHHMRLRLLKLVRFTSFLHAWCWVSVSCAVYGILLRCISSKASHSFLAPRNASCFRNERVISRANKTLKPFWLHVDFWKFFLGFFAHLHHHQTSIPIPPQLHAASFLGLIIILTTFIL